MNKDFQKITTLGALKKSGYQPRLIKDEMRDNLVHRLKNKLPLFEGIIGFDETVLPSLNRAVLSRHNIILLGLRGQAKTRIARLMVELLDEYIPVVQGSEINDDPMQPVSRSAKDLIREMGDDTPITWLHRSQRYTEKLATPDVTVADLVGDLDPIKAANQKLSYSDEKVIHFGLIPRSHRSIFVINELPDLQARIQVALFNILQEEDLQIRGFKLRLPLDIQFIFTANPEDYTNRGSIVTPLKDRIDSQILTHYPRDIKTARQITEQEARITDQQKKNINVPDLIRDLIEQISFEARISEYVDANSGVSARLSISGYENLVSTVERRMIINDEKKAIARISDLYGLVPSITGKVELVYEGEQEGVHKIAHILINSAIKSQYNALFPNPENWKNAPQNNPYQDVLSWFSGDNIAEILMESSEKKYRSQLDEIKGLKKLCQKLVKDLNDDEVYVWMEFILHGLAEYSFLSKHPLDMSVRFKDIMSVVMNMSDDEEDEEDYGRIQDFI